MFQEDLIALATEYANDAVSDWADVDAWDAAFEKVLAELERQYGYPDYRNYN